MGSGAEPAYLAALAAVPPRQTAGGRTSCPGEQAESGGRKADNLGLPSAGIREPATVSNLTLRNQLKRLNRKTLGYSKSPEMHDRIIGTFIEREYYA